MVPDDLPITENSIPSMVRGDINDIGSYVDNKDHHNKTMWEKQVQSRKQAMFMREYMKRPFSELDIEHVHEHLQDSRSIMDNTDLKPRASAAENKKRYEEYFGVTFEIPTVHTLDAKIYPKDPSY